MRDLDSAYENFFKKRAGYPRFKSKHNHTQSYRTNNVDSCVRIVDKRVRLPKVGFVKIKQSRTFDGRILNATISYTASGKYFISLCVETDKEQLVAYMRKLNVEVNKVYEVISERKSGNM